MTSGSPVRDLDVAVQGNALKLKKDIEKSGGVIAGEHDATQTLFVTFPGGVRMEIGGTLSVTYPKPGKPVYKPATILDDLRRRDFTANAMALSLNDGSYALLMDPLNGVADIENRELRLVNNYGFIEDPARMIRAARFSARLGWLMDERTQARYETGKQEEYITALDDFHRGYETEEIFHEEDPLRVLRRLESEGWMKYLFPALTVAKANVPEMERLRDVQGQLLTQGIHAETAAASFPLLTAKLAPKDVAALKASFVRPGFVAEVEALEGEGKAFAAELAGKNASSPSQAWKLLHASKPESVLWVAFSSKNTAIQAKFKGFFSEWQQAKQKLPYALMQEMRITPDLPVYEELLDKLFFELMDGKLTTTEDMKAFLEPYSPPAPPPPVHLRRARVAKKDAKPKSRKKAAAPVVPDAEPVAVVHVAAAKSEVPVKVVASTKPAPVKAAAKKVVAPAKKVPVKVAKKVVKAPPAKVVAKKTPVKPVARKAASKAPAKKVPAKVVKKAAVAKKPVKKTAPVLKKAAKTPVKALAKKSPAKRR